MLLVSQRPDSQLKTNTSRAVCFPFLKSNVVPFEQFAARFSNPLVPFERFASCLSSSPFRAACLLFLSVLFLKSNLVPLGRFASCFSNTLVLFERFAPCFSNPLVPFERVASCFSILESLSSVVFPVFARPVSQIKSSPSRAVCIPLNQIQCLFERFASRCSNQSSACSSGLLPAAQINPVPFERFASCFSTL